MAVAERPWQADTDDQTPCRATSAGAVLSTLLGRLLCLRLSPDDRVVFRGGCPQHPLGEAAVSEA